MLTSDIKEQLDGLYKNIKDWNILYLTIKNQDLSKLTKPEDCVDCLRIHDSVIEGAAFLPDWLKIMVYEIDKATWLDDQHKQEQMLKARECAAILAMDRPEPMASFLREYRPRVVERLLALYQSPEEMEECALVKMFTGGSVH